jgi:hypothetical protein
LTTAILSASRAVASQCALQKAGHPDPSATARAAALAAPVLLDDDAHVEPHHRPDIGDERAIGAQDEHLLVARGERGADLHHAGIERAGEGVDLAQGIELHRKVASAIGSASV